MSQRDMNDSAIRLDIDGQPSCDLLATRLLKPDSGNIRSDQQKRECFGGGFDCFWTFSTASLGAIWDAYAE
jgi:hypothetical protein